MCAPDEDSNRNLSKSPTTRSDGQDVKGFSVNQLELHPRVFQQEAVEATVSAGAVVQSYSPFGTGDLLTSKRVVELAKSSTLSPCQLLLQYAFAKGRSAYKTKLPSSI